MRPHTAHPAPGDRDGHTLTATVGDVLEYMHTDAAIELLYAQDNLAAGRPLNDPAAMMLETDMDDAVDSAEAETIDSATVDRTAPIAGAEAAADATTTTTTAASSEASPISQRTSILRFLSPGFVVKASRNAVQELLGGVRRARSELAGATARARQCFTP